MPHKQLASRPGPGPLTVERRAAKDYYPRSDLCYVIRKNAAYTALVVTKADANLYAAAPNLLDALRTLVIDIETDGGVSDESWPQLDVARAAIAKAEGSATIS